MKHSILLSVLLLTVAPSFGQIVSVEEAVQISMQKNYDVQVVMNTSALANNDRRYSYGVFLPAVNANGVYNKTTSNSRNLTFSDVENKFPEAKQTNTNASVQVVWPIFDGTRMFATRKRIGEISALGELNVRNQMMNTAAAVIANYFGIVRQKQQLKAIREQMSVSEERVKLAERKLQVGTGGKPELLQAKVDLNAFRTAAIQQEALILTLKNQLNGALAMQLADGFEVGDTIPINLGLTLDEIAREIERANPLLIAQKKTIDVAKATLWESRAGRSPVINLIGGYNILNRSENEVQITPATQRLTQSSGYNYGLSVQIPILNNMNVNRLIGQGKINVERQQLIYNQQLTLTLVGVQVAYISYDNAKKTLQIEEENILLAKENVDIALQGFRRGVTTFIELRTAQQSLADAYNRLIAARYLAKLSETELFRLQGSLLN